MGDDASAGSRVEEQEPEYAVEHLENVLLNVESHSTTKEWARVAGTCKTLWDAQLSRIELTACTPVAGYRFALKRVQAASSIALTVSGGTSDDSFNALKEAFLGGSRVLQSVKHLSVTDVRYRRFENTDVTYLFKAFPNLQVASLQAASISGSDLGAWPMLRHLDQKTDIGQLLQSSNLLNMHAFPLLETLSLCAYRDTGSVQQLDLHLLSVHSLRRLHIEDWSPRTLTVPICCQVHAIWSWSSRYTKRMHETPKWLVSPCWKAPRTKIASLVADYKEIEDILEKADMQGCLSQLESLRLYYSGYPITSMVLKLSHLHSLRQLTIENWSPESIEVSAHCEVHAVWKRVGVRKGKTRDWLNSQCWTAPRAGISLTSLVVLGMCQCTADISDMQVGRINEIVKCHSELRSLRLRSWRLGSEEAPLTFSSDHVKILKSPLVVEIETTKGCWLHLKDTLPIKHLDLNICGLLNDA